MYFPIGWPKIIKIPDLEHFNLKQVTCNRDRLLFSVITEDSITIWHCKPCVPIVFHRRTSKSLEKYGLNLLAEWKPDSSQIVIVTSEGHLLFYKLDVISDQKTLYKQMDSPLASLRRDSAELFVKEIIPPISLTLNQEIFVWDGKITGIVCITMTEFMISTTENHVLRYRWDGTQYRDFNLDLRRIPFCINQQVSKAVPIVEENIFIVDIDYSPLVGGFSIVLNDGRAAFLTASSLKFDPNQVQGIWAQGIEDATCTKFNHKYRLITFGRTNSECVVYTVDESTGGLEISHNCVLSSKDYPRNPGEISEIIWTPDGCALVVAWSKGGIGVWSTFGALLMCSLGWDYGLNVDIQKANPLQILSMEFGVEGYQLWMIQKENNYSDNYKTNLIQMDFVKSALTVNPCMSHQCHLYLQGEDKLYVNSANTLIKIFSERSDKEDDVLGNFASETTLAEGRQWLVIPVPSTYSATNWPIRYSAIDSDGQNMAVAGRTGVAHYSLQLRKWKLFGNETQEKDFIVTAGLLWWRDFLVMGCYSILENTDELRFYPKDLRLDNQHATMVSLSSALVLINILQDQLITFGCDAQVNIWFLNQSESGAKVEITKLQCIDISSLNVHPACFAFIALTSLKTENRGQQNLSESLVLNVSGRLLLVQRETHNGDSYTCSMPTILASCVENVWVPAQLKQDKVHLTEALWLFCGSHGMRVWLPLYPKNKDKLHTFMSKRIMLPFHLKIYPLAILFEDAILLGVENDAVLYISDTNSPFSLPFSVLERTSQVYLHQILRQLIRRNLGFHAWEIARSCMSLSYFPHSLELLLHEVLEEEATSKEPIPDAQLPSVIEFIMEFPLYLQTVVQCARKTEIALWPYLFSAAGKPKDLFQECLSKGQLETAASYLIILQNLETSAISRQYATLLLNTALDRSKWELAKDLVRFLRAIDPNDVESPRNSFVLPVKLGITPQSSVTPNAEDISLILGNVQGPRVRSYSTTISPKIIDTKSSNVNSGSDNQSNKRKKSIQSSGKEELKQESKNSTDGSAEEFFIDVILQKHARRLLSEYQLIDLGYMAAQLDFHLVSWLVKERERAAKIDDIVKVLKNVHEDFNWPYPNSSLNSKNNSTGRSSEPQSPIENNSGNIDDHLKALKIDINTYPNNSSRISDSGYMSVQGQPCSGLVTLINRIDNTSQLLETEGDHLSNPVDISDSDSQLEKVAIKKFSTSTMSPTEERNFGTLPFHLQTTDLGMNMDNSVVSTMSSVWGEDRDQLSMLNENWEVPSTQILEQLSKTGDKGSQKSEFQLRYLLQLFMEANCLEWSLLISIILRDAMAVLRTINAARSPDQSIEAVMRLRQHLLLINYWTNTECLAYKTFMLAIQNQISVLSKILENKLQQQKIIEYQQNLKNTLKKVSSQIPARSRNSSTNDSNSQTSSSKENKATVSNSIVKEKESNVKKDCDTNINAKTDEAEDSFLPESTGCVIS